MTKKSKYKLPKNDDELKQLLRNLGRTDEQIEAIIDFAKLSKALHTDDLDEVVKDLKKKYLTSGE